MSGLNSLTRWRLLTQLVTAVILCKLFIFLSWDCPHGYRRSVTSTSMDSVFVFGLRNRGPTRSPFSIIHYTAVRVRAIFENGALRTSVSQVAKGAPSDSGQKPERVKVMCGARRHTPSAERTRAG